MSFNSLIEYVYLIPVILVSLSFHEFAHAYISYRLGDPTAKNLGRLTINPLKHLDPIGTIMMFAARVGWAKPVPINPVYYKDRKKGTMLVSIAGPLSNIILAFIFAFPMLYLGQKVDYLSSSYVNIAVIMYNISMLFFLVNINLAIFNIIPVPPLDGSKILSGILPSRYYFKFMEYENYIGIIFLLLIFVFPGVLGTVMSPFVKVIQTAILTVVKPIVGMLI